MRENGIKEEKSKTGRRSDLIIQMFSCHINENY